MSQPQTSQMVIDVRELFKFQPKELLLGLKTDLNLLLEDNQAVKVNYKEIIILRYLLEIMKFFPNVKITSKYLLNHYKTNGFFTGKTLSSWIEVALQDIILLEVKPKQNRDLLVPVYRQLWETFNSLYNEVVFNNLEYADSLIIEDLLDVQMDERLIKAMHNVTKLQTPESVTKTYEILEDIINHKEEIRDNQIVKRCISKTVNMNQVKQLLGSRGYVTEIDNHIFKYPVASSFTLGMADIYDMAIESRAGAKALYVSNKAIQTSEYTARGLQLVTMIVERLVDGDCGSKEYMDWYVEPGNKDKKPDLPNLLGIRFLNPETNKEETITKEHKDLINGKTIKIRTPLSCKHSDPRAICTACFGDLAYSIPKNTNIGHFASTELTESTSQGILSQKHLVASASSGSITLDAIASKFFIIKKGNTYHIRPDLFKKDESFKLIIDQESGFGIKDLNPNIVINKLNPQRVTRINDIFISHTDKNGKEMIYPIQIKVGNKYGFFTYEFLEYIIKSSIKIDNMDRYVIDLKDWNIKLPIISMPDVEFDFLTLVKQLVELFRHTKSDYTGVSDETPEYILQKLFDLVNKKIDTNIALLAVIVYAFTANDPENGDYSLARHSKEKKMVKLDTLIQNRSLGAGYAWESVNTSIVSPRSYRGQNAVEHPMDAFIAPNEVLNKHYGR